MSRSTASKWRMPAMATAAALIVVAGVWTSKHLAAGAAPKAETGTTPEGDHFKGSAKAKVTLMEFTDFECPYCQRFHERLKEAVDDVGPDNVRVVFRNWPLPFHKDAFRLAVAARCAGVQGRFWEYADWIYDTAASTADNAEKRSKEFAEANLITQAEKLGASRDRFGSCIKSMAEISKIEADAKEAEKLGGTGTPFVLINGKKWEGNWAAAGILEKALKDAAR